MPTLITTADAQDAAARLALARAQFRSRHPRPTASGDLTCPRCLAVPGQACHGGYRERRAGGGTITSHPERRALLDGAVTAWRTALAAVTAAHYVEPAPAARVLDFRLSSHVGRARRRDALDLDQRSTA